MSAGSVYNASTANGIGSAFASFGPVSQNLSRAGLLAWATTSFGVNFTLKYAVLSFFFRICEVAKELTMDCKRAPSNYAVPLPRHLGTNQAAHYLTDVVIMEPECQWFAPTNLRPPAGFSFLVDTTADLTPDVQISWKSSYSNSMGTLNFVCEKV
jgi:hypothetical protein